MEVSVLTHGTCSTNMTHGGSSNVTHGGTSIDSWMYTNMTHGGSNIVTHGGSSNVSHGGDMGH